MHPSYYINSNGNTSFSTIDQQFSTIDYQQWMTSFCYFNHETPNLMQSTMENVSGYNNHGISFLAADHGNSHVNFENNCLKDKIRSCKKDRHRKINTARGPKDRRMRLSLDVAKKFFRLQDLLGFDKASNTIQWLLIKSQPAIQDLRPQQSNQSQDLVGASNCPSSGSDSCEVVSVNDDQFCKKRFESEVRKITREKARERARKRTSEKRSIKVGCDVVDRVMDGSTNRLGLWVAFGEDHDQVRLITDQAENSSSRFQLKQGIAGENSSIISSNWNSSFLFNYHHNLGLPHEHLGEFQNLGKPWECINN